MAGPDGTVATTVQEQQVTLVPDRRTYQPGQSATLLVTSPITTGTGLITLTHNGIVSTKTFPISDSSAVVTVPISEASVPGVTANVEVVGTVPRADDPAGGAGTRPGYATGQIDLSVSTVTRSLTVTAKPRQSTVKPGGQTTVDVKVADASGKPVAGSQFEVVVVDEAVLALSGNQRPDPLATFYPPDQSWLSAVYGRADVMLGTAAPPGSGAAAGYSSAGASSGAAPASSASSSSASFAAGGAASDSANAPSPAQAAPVNGNAATVTTPIDQRSAFQALALFRPTVTTGADGTAAIPVTLPDNLTRYRVQVIAVSGPNRFGTGDATITAALPVDRPARRRRAS